MYVSSTFANVKEVRTQHGIRFVGNESQQVEDTLTSEEALQITINGEPFSITMRTPGYEKELVRGLLHSEQVYHNLKQGFRLTTTCINDRGIVTSVNLLLDEDEKGQGALSERNLMSVSSCGICGKQDATDIGLEGDPIQYEDKIDHSIIPVLFDKMAHMQSTFQKSGGSHAAAICTPQGEVLCVREDIGRHNAVDKAVGHILEEGLANSAKILLVSGRVSFEIISKAYHAGIPVLAAVSAPSDLAVESAERMGITLLGFCRGDKLTVYSCYDRIK